MRIVLGTLAFAWLAASAFAQQRKDGPSNEKAQKSYQLALDDLHHKRLERALDGFKKADKQDDGHCLACQKQIIKLGVMLGNWKGVELAAGEMVIEAQGDKETAKAHYRFAQLLMEHAWQKHKEDLFTRAHDETMKALASYASFTDAILLDGRILANLHQNAEAKERFEQVTRITSPDDPNHQRALRYIAEPELAGARMAPPFAVTTLDGSRLSMDELEGKVVLVDFWATWCGPCRSALPHLRDVARKFRGEPLVILSVSLDSNEQRWQDFVAKNEMTWPQYCDGGFNGPVAKMFGVTAIPQTFTIDADGIIQDQHIGDASIEGKLKKLIARARELMPPQDAPN